MQILQGMAASDFGELYLEIFSAAGFEFQSRRRG